MNNLKGIKIIAYEGSLIGRKTIKGSLVLRGKHLVMEKRTLHRSFLRSELAQEGG